MVRVLLDQEGTPAWNMAVDEALLRLCKEPILRFYGWSEPAVSIGYFQPYAVVPQGRSFIRRYTGGGLVDHAVDFTYTIVLPKRHELYAAGTAVSYERIHEAIAEGLRTAGVDASLAPCCFEGDAKACFQKPVKFDVMSQSQKLAGAAQRRTREGCLHQGSLQVPMPFDLIKTSLEPGLVRLLDNQFAASKLTEQEIVLAHDLESKRYGTKEWNYSR
jgi:lipoate-protein ligase A